MSSELKSLTWFSILFLVTSSLTLIHELIHWEICEIYEVDCKIVWWGLWGKTLVNYSQFKQLRPMDRSNFRFLHALHEIISYNLVTLLGIALIYNLLTGKRK